MRPHRPPPPPPLQIIGRWQQTSDIPAHRHLRGAPAGPGRTFDNGCATLPCGSTVFAAKALPLPCAFPLPIVAKALPLPCVFPLPFVANILHLPCVFKLPFTAKTLPVPCGDAGRGVGGVPGCPCTSVGEENLLMQVIDRASPNGLQRRPLQRSKSIVDHSPCGASLWSLDGLPTTAPFAL